MAILISLQRWMDRATRHSWLASLALRAYLAPVYWVAGTNKLAGFDNVVAWFGNTEWGLGLPFPTLMAALATGAEVLGAVLLTLGLGVRWISIPLMITMLVAAFKVHWVHGWQAVHDYHSPWPSAHIDEAMTRLEQARTILQQHGDWAYLTEYGNFVVSNNGMEWAITYFVMLLALFFLGGGRWVSLDDWIRRQMEKRGLLQH